MKENKEAKMQLLDEVKDLPKEERKAKMVEFDFIILLNMI